MPYKNRELAKIRRAENYQKMKNDPEFIAKRKAYNEATKAHKQQYDKERRTSKDPSYYREINQRYAAKRKSDPVRHAQARQMQNQWVRQYRDPVGHALRDRIRSALTSQNVRKTLASEELLGTSIAEAKAHIENQFTTGMSWGKFGPALDEIHIDHIIPLCSFDLSKRSEQLKAFHYTNLQPLWGRDNLRKGSKLDFKL